MPHSAGWSWHKPIWWLLHASLAATFATALHRYLLKSQVQEPWAFTGWLLLVYGIAVLCRVMADHDRLEASRLAATWRRLGWHELVLLALFLLLFAVQNATFDRARSDGRYYFVQVRSLVIDWNLELTDDALAFGGRDVADLYAVGAPLLWLPFYVAAHVWLWVWGLLGHEVLLNGFWNPYQRAAGFGTLVYGFAALVLIYDLARRNYCRNIALLATTAVTAGSFVLWYAAIDATMSHGISMFTCTLFLYVWERTRGGRTTGQWAVLGLVAGLMTMARWQNLLFAIVPAIEIAGIHVRRAWRSDRPIVRIPDVKSYLAFGSATLVTFLPQMAVWRVNRGGWLDHPARAHNVHWLEPEFAHVLFSSNRGLFSWSPVVYLAAIGLVILLIHRWRLAWPLVLVFLMQVYVNATVEYWWGGAGFGARRFSNCALVFGIGLAALLEMCRRRPLLAPTTALVALVSVNSVFMYEMKRGTLPAETRVPADMLLERVYRYTGNPFGFPQSLLVALRTGTGMSFYDQLGSRAYNNLAIDVGAGTREDWLVAGWSGPENSPAGDFRWAVGEEARIVVPLRESDAYLLRVRSAPFRYPDAPVQVMRVVVNGGLVARIGLPDGLRWHEIRVPAEHIRAGLNRFDFRFAYARSPQDLGLHDDPRRLAVRFDRIELLRDGR